MKKKYIIIPVVMISAVALLIFNRDTPLEKLAKHVKRGDVLFAQGEYRKARLEYKNASKINPTDVEVEYRWGLVDEAEGDIRSAATAFRQAEQQDPHFHKAKLKMAHYYLLGESMDEAQERVDFVLAEDPDNAEAHAINAAILLRKKDFEGTKKEASFALEKEPTNINAIAVMTGLYLAQGDIEKAGEVVENGIKLLPKDVSLLMLKAKIYEEPLNIEKINEAYQGLFSLKPNDIQFRLYLANIYINLKKIDKAEEVLRQAIQDMPTNWDIKREFINFLNKNRDLEAVEKEIDIYAKKYPQHNEVYLWLAEIYIANDDTEKAIELFNKIIAKGDNDKNSLDARTSLAQINFIKGDKESAKKAADSVLEISPNNTQALFIQAAIAADVGDYKTAIADLRKIIHSEPKEKKAYKLLSEVFLMQGHNDLAIETLNQLIDIDPTNSQSLVRLSQLYSLNGDNDHAIKILNTVNEKDPNYAIGWENTARLAIIMKDPAAMKLAIENLDKIEGQEILSIFLKGELASLTGKEMYAFSSYSKVIEADPSSPMAEHALYSLIKEHSKPDELQMVIDYIATLKTDSPYVSTILGECYIYLGKIDLAKTAFNKAIINNPKNQSPYIHLAKIYLNEKKNDEAIAILKTASEEIPNDASASLIQAGIFLGLGQYDKSIEIYDSILKTNPKVNEAANNMASIIADYRYTDPIMLEKAQRIAERFEDFKNPLFLDTLGWVYYRQGKFDKALKIIERSIEINPKASQEIHYHYGVILLEEGDIAKAKEELLLATEENANYATLDEAKKLLKKITISE